jgi:cysteine desulfuration protein SufE
MSDLREAAMTTIDDIRADFDLLDNWEDRYRYIMELGRALPPLPEPLRTEANKVRGCASQVWLATHVHRQGAEPTLTFDGDSDSHLVRGLVAVLFALFQGQSARRILESDAHAALGSLGLEQSLTPQRSNGLASMVKRIREDAARALDAP